MKRGLTLIEVLIVIIFFTILASVSVYIFRIVLTSWSSQDERAGISISIDFEIEKMVRELREATAIQSVNLDEIRFTTDTDYIYYLYNAIESYPPGFADPALFYELKRTTLAGGIIAGTFTYGDGTVLIRDVVPPPTSDLAVNANTATIDLTVKREGETIHSRTEVRPRNI